jgi:hypothetical protein
MSGCFIRTLLDEVHYQSARLLGGDLAERVAAAGTLAK